MKDSCDFVTLWGRLATCPWSLDIHAFVWGRLAICGRLVIGLSLWMLHWTGPIANRPQVTNLPHVTKNHNVQS